MKQYSENCTADPPKDGSATVSKAEAPFDVAQDRLGTRSKELLIKKILRSLRTRRLCGEYFFRENLE